MKVYIGIDIGGTNVKLAVVGDTGRIRARGAIDTQPDETPQKTFRRIRLACDSLLKSLTNTDLVAAGVGCAGLIDPVRGYLLLSPNLPVWEKSPIERIARRALGVYTFVDNDANCAAYGEYRVGAGRGVKNLVFITLGTGVGGGVVIDGRLLRGVANYAAELGHTTINFDGPKCHCGNRGCLEAYVGSYGLVRSARSRLRQGKGRVLRRWVTEDKKPLTPWLIFEAARKGDAAATAVVKEAGGLLGIGLASFINIFNPERVVLGGGISSSFDLLEPHVEKAISRSAFGESARLAVVTRSVLGNDASVAGAAMLAKDAIEARKRG
jgi:glucokinase